MKHTFVVDVDVDDRSWATAAGLSRSEDPRADQRHYLTDAPEAIRAALNRGLLEEAGAVITIREETSR